MPPAFQFLTGKVEKEDTDGSYLALFSSEFLLVKQTASELYISPVRILQEFHEEFKRRMRQEDGGHP